jgi:hypothetical protein
VTASFAAAPLRHDEVTGLYQYGSGEQTLFSRTVSITEESPTHLKVVVSIDWTERTGAKQLMLEYHLYDWVQ